MKIIQELPEDIPISPDLKKRARYFFVVQFLGPRYYIPATFELIKLFKAMGITIKKIENGYRVEPYKKAAYAETFIQDLIASLYMQARDTVGKEVYEKLSREIKDGLEGMFQKRLSQNISQDIEDAMQKRIEAKP